MNTYISLFSSAGIGCFGFKQENFECIATNELIRRRLDIQRFNHKCKYSSGYICGDITSKETKEKLFSEVRLWEKQENLKQVDVIIATPPCQGMSVANHKKNNKEIIRNSLVIESIKIIKVLKPKFFLFENVPAFMKTICTDVDGTDKTIEKAIQDNLGGAYSYAYKIINFKNYGACSSRQRTIVLGVSNDYANEVSPFELYPDKKEELTLRKVIGKMPSLTKMGEIDPKDIYHSFRPYPEHMRCWISSLKEGQSAFDNPNDLEKPHQIVNGEIVFNKQKNADKYKRQYWNKVGPCVHTRNDQLASQNTVHPKDDRVFSIRELMRMMTVPETFKWVEEDLNTLNALPQKAKEKFLKKEEIKIRQSLGEAVPTIVFKEIAHKIKEILSHPLLTTAQINAIISKYDFSDVDKLSHFIESNPLNLSNATLSRIAELANTKRTDTAAYFTNKMLITEMVKQLPDMEQDNIRILEPSVGVGNFVPLIFKKYENKHVQLDLVDIDPVSINILKILLSKYNIPSTFKINYIVDDFLLHDFKNQYDLVIGNPPFYKMKAQENSLYNKYKKNAINKNSRNICSFFLDKAVKISNYVALILPKFILNTPEFKDTRDYLSERCVECVIDFGEKGFPGVLVETVALFVNNTSKISTTKIISLLKNLIIIQPQKYIFDKSLPYWIIYRNGLFDEVCKKLTFNVFDVFRDRQITKSYLLAAENDHSIRILKSRNIQDNSLQIINIAGYDSFIDIKDAKKFSVFDFCDRDDIYLTPNMTYKPRVIKKPKHVLVNGSVAILIPKKGISPTPKQLEYYVSDEYRNFYQIARNFQTRSLNVDACSVYFYGLLKG